MTAVRERVHDEKVRVEAELLELKRACSSFSDRDEEIAELKRVIPEILWTRTYFAKFLKAYPELGNSSASAADTDDVPAKQFLKQSAMPMVKRFLNSPLVFFTQTEGPDRDPTWLQSLPNDALRLFMKHALDLAQGSYQPEIKHNK